MNDLISIVICTFNRAEVLPTCLEHIVDQDAAPSQYEVLIVDNKSMDETPSICRECIRLNPNHTIRYVVEENQGHTFARNRGIAESTGNVITFIDDDAYASRNFVSAIRQFFADHPDAAAMGGKIIPLYESKQPKWMSNYLLPLVSALDMGNKRRVLRDRKFPIGANMSFRRHVFDDYGLFKTELGRRGDGLEGGDEKELFIRLKLNKEKIYYAPNPKVKHFIPDRRVTIEYIRGLARGVGTSERKRLSMYGRGEVLKKVFEEILKIGGTMVLWLLFMLKMEPQKAVMLVRFRYWVLSALIRK